MNNGQEGLGEVVVTRGDASEMLETSKEALDQIASLVEMQIELARCEAIGSGRNHSFDAGREMVSVVAHVSHAPPNAAVTPTGKANVCVLSQLPNTRGRSRQGLPVRKIRRTTSTKRRRPLVLQPATLVTDDAHAAR